jgi:hypothetical protein
MVSKLSKEFSVVFFEKENKYTVVPSSWLTEDKQGCYWPSKNTKKAQELIKSANSQPSPQWKDFSVNIIKQYGILI